MRRCFGVDEEYYQQCHKNITWIVMDHRIYYLFILP
jgi:hypothetical protein